MISRKAMVAAVSAAVLLATQVMAQQQEQESASAEPAPGRYQMSPVESGILRLDTQTGDVSFCRSLDDQWVCQTAADDRVALDDEIARLEEENQTLRDRIAELEKPGGEHTLTLPSDEELDQVISFMERLMRRFYAFARSLRPGAQEET